ncbi:MAG: hypothetical protein LBL98_00305 [Ruminococcus sp.]|jgi:hypothetical protein|nr:hypothetical protein [Ruminococcus sp.]
MKKAIRSLLTGLLTAVLAAGVLSFPASASEDSTFAFDSDIGADMWKTDNAELAAKNGFGYEVSDAEVFEGAGALAVFESFTGDIDTSQVGGAYITASDIGLKSFAGCTITAELFPTGAATARGAQFIIYTDGMLYLPVAQTTFTPDKWNHITLIIPDNCENTRLGFLTPVYSTFSGDAFYLDEITVTLPDGSTVANIGDFQAPAEQHDAVLSGWVAGLIYAVLGVAAAGIIGLIIILVYRRTKRYR